MNKVTETERKCSVCNNIRPINDFKENRGNFRRLCSKCFKIKKKEYRTRSDNKRKEKRRLKWKDDSSYRERNYDAVRKYRSNNKKLLAARNREKRRRIRENVLTKYGGRCVCCGETQFEFLAVDHVNNNGSKERKEIGGSCRVYKKLLTLPIQSDYQILCHNCNMSIGFYGYCPHGNIPPRPKKLKYEEDDDELSDL